MVEKEEALLSKRVLYIGSSVPLETSAGLDAIQQPLRERYPVNDDKHLQGIMSTLTVLASGLQLQMDQDPGSNEPGTVIVFPIGSLTLCAAVRCIHQINAATGEKMAKFVSLSSPAARGANASRPAIFTAITRRTTGLKVLECHGFVCHSEQDALDLVRVTSQADKASKAKLNGRILTHPPPSESGGLSSPEFPVRLAPGDKQQQVAPEFFDPPPRQGYFYNAKNSMIRTYEMTQLAEQMPPLSSRPASDRRSVVSSPPTANPTPRGRAISPPPAFATLQRSSQGPAIATLPRPPPPGPALIPVRTLPPPPRPRFFSPPPTLLRPRMVPVGRVRDPYVFVPPPPLYMDAPYARKRTPPRPRGSASSRSSSSRSSSPRHDVTMPRRMVNGDGDASSEVSSRPVTPPTDYDQKPRKERQSRRDKYDARGGHHHPDFPPPPPRMLVPAAYPPEMYMVPPPPRFGPHGPGMFYTLDRARARSVPPGEDRMGTGKKKGKKTKKEKKKSKKHGAAPSDISTDSMGYQSEIPPNTMLLDRSFPRHPGRRFEYLNKNERAFAASLHEEKKGATAAPPSAYLLNEHMAERAARNGGEDFHW